jgi:hypothetical protein
MTPDFPYIWTWRRRSWDLPGLRCRTPWFGDGVDRAGLACRILARGGRNSALIEFEDGYRVITRRGGLRRRPPPHA